MAGQASVLRIPNFVKAESPARLRELMLEKNAEKGRQHDWLKGIVYNQKENKWYAWYDEVVEVDFVSGEIISG